MFRISSRKARFIANCGGEGGTPGPCPLNKPRSKAAKKRTITQAAQLLEKHGYSLEGGADYDLKNKVARYKVKQPDGSIKVMTSHEIESVIGK